MSQLMAGKFIYKVQDNPARVIEGEAVIVTPQDSMLHSLNSVGTFIWEQADGTRDLGTIVDQICEHFEIDRNQAYADATSFVETCVQKSVLVLKDERAGDDT